MVAYRFEESRSGDCVRRHLRGYSGILQVDGYAAYNKLIRNDGPRLAGCWAHSRRHFFELHAAGASEIATATVERMTELGSLRQMSAVKASRHEPMRGRLSRHQSSPGCSRCGSRPCRASLGNRSSPRPCAMPLPGARALSASWRTASSSAPPTLSSAPSGPRP